ncbi:AAA family ATPase [Arthrobacter sp. GCM10027362]|uniref:ATP-binding protein n=1 Tax=Arthrobacter sp. GCM10027362 TaxID=3273379 RepID=UPI0036371C95
MKHEYYADALRAIGGQLRDLLDDEQRKNFHQIAGRLNSEIEARHGHIPARVEGLVTLQAVLEAQGLRPYGSEDPDSYDKLLRDLAVTQEADKLRIREEARRQVQAEQADTFTPPTPMPLELLIEAAHEGEDEWRIEGLWQAGGRALFVAPFKGGKTVTMMNLMRSLADGEPFLGRFPVNPPAIDDVHDVAPILLIDTEMTQRQLGRWLEQQGIRNRHHIEVLCLRGRLSQFNILDPEIRAKWVRVIEGAQVVILDNLRPVLDALGLDENHEAGKFLTAWDETMHDAQVSESLIVHHTGHGQERARGDSALLASNDAIWTLIRDGDEAGSPRFFKALGRDVDVPEGRLEFEPATRRLSMAGGSRKDARADEAIPTILELLGQHDALSGRQIHEALAGTGFSRRQISEALIRAHNQKLILVYDGPKKARMHSLIPSSAPVRGSAPPVRRRTGSECASAPYRKAHSPAHEHDGESEEELAHSTPLPGMEDPSHDDT